VTEGEEEGDCGLPEISDDWGCGQEEEETEGDACAEYDDSLGELLDECA
jgi:hypothetical protein